MSHNHVLACLLLAALVGSCAPAPALSEGEARIRRVENGLVPVSAAGPTRLAGTRPLADRMAHHGVLGLSIAVIDGYQLAWARGYGVLDAQTSEPVTPDTLFHAGSVAKTLSADAALSLVQEGRLDLDQNVNELLVSWQVPENGYTVVDKVTLRRLLSHSAGLEDGFTNRSVYDPFPDYVGRAGSAPTVSLRALLDADSGVDVDGPARVTMAPGSAYRYANADYAVLEILLEDITGRPFDEFMAETILDPLGMSFSTFAQPLPDELRKRASSEHNPDGEPFPGERMHFPYRAAGGLWTTPSDLARFALEVLRAYRGDPEVLLSQAMVVEMLTPQIAAPPNTLFDASGLGFHLSGEGDGMGFWHTGGTWGSACVLWAYPATGQGAVVMTNSTGGNGLLLFEILFSIAQEYGWPLEGN